MLRKIILRFKREDLMGECRRLHNEELYDLCFSRNIIRVTKSRKMRRTGHVARMGYRRGTYRVLVGRKRGKYNTRKT
jgi:hypothetical protein